jgi:hypothetical protein
MDARLKAKAKVLEELKQYASKSSARALKEKYAPKPPPAPEPVQAEAAPDVDPLADVDLDALLGG